VTAEASEPTDFWRPVRTQARLDSCGDATMATIFVSLIGALAFGMYRLLRLLLRRVRPHRV
jgi:hypothetical protein